MNVKFEYLNSDAIRIDGEIFHPYAFGFDRPSNIVVGYAGIFHICIRVFEPRLDWNEKQQLLKVPIALFNPPFPYHHQCFSVSSGYSKFVDFWLSKECIEFFKKVDKKYHDYRMELEGPENAMLATDFKINKTGTLPDVMRSGKYYFWFNDHARSEFFGQ